MRRGGQYYVVKCMGMYLAQGKGQGFKPFLHCARIFATDWEALDAGRVALDVTPGVPLPEVEAVRVICEIREAVK